MNIGVMGFYGFGNAGDERILDILQSFLAPHRVFAFPTAFQPNAETISRLNSFDFLILGGGGLFHDTPTSPFDTFDQWGDQLKTPIGILGLGVKHLNARHVQSTHKLVDRAEFFVVRDAESKRLIAHPDVQVSSDLTFYEPFRILPHRKAEGMPIICGVNLRPMRVGVSQWIEAVASLPCEKRAVPLSSVSLYDDRQSLRELDPACPARFSPSLYEHLDILIGTAFHSIVFALQIGIPVIAINYHSKVRRLMEEAGLDKYVLEWNEYEQLGACYEQLLAEQDHVREQMQDFTAKAQDQLVRVLHDIKIKINACEKNTFTALQAISSEAKISIMVQCLDQPLSYVSKTVQSCLNQTYQNLEVILLGDAQRLNSIPLDSQLRHCIKVIEQNKKGADWVKIGLNHAQGDYITWMRAGEWYADDAVHLLMKLLTERPEVDLVYADLFLTNEGYNEHKIELSETYSADDFIFWTPCFLTKRSKALTVWSLQSSTKDIHKEMRVWRDFALHVSHPLLFRPASQSEIYLHYSAIAYAQGEVEQAERYLIEANKSNPHLIDSLKHGECAFNFFWSFRHQVNLEVDLVTYLEMICTNLPTATDELRKLRQAFISRASITEAFILAEQGEMQQVQHLLFRSIWHDPKWLLNRGVLSLLGQTLFGRSILQTYRSAKSQIGQKFKPII